ncbi:MAG TPA: chemotaxis protein CheA [Desulfuromonadaceae bacterium]|jgi:two-component system chemotaxis sensor kinase CheA
MDLSPYRDLFLSESQGHIKSSNELIVKLESHSADKSIVDELFRHAHSLKGMAATMQFQPLAALAHAMEDLLSKVRSGELTIESALIDLLLEGNDALSLMISIIESGKDQLSDNPALISRLTEFSPASQSITQATAPPDSAPSAIETPAQTGSQPGVFRHSDSFKNIRIRTEVLDRLVNITGELITTRHQLADQARLFPQKLNEPLNRLTLLLRDLRDEVLQARMLPFTFVSERLPRLVRDLARQQGKEIAFHIEGTEIELDRGILEEIAEPLVHILRNAVDHGMERPAQRVADGKPANGMISICVTRDKDHVNVVISDDGRGMNSGLIIQKAIEKGLISSAQAASLTPQEALMLICAPGFSTAATVTDISGRGVGMDAVRSSLHNLGGNLSIESVPGQGSTFTLRLPITVSIINALLVECGKLVIAFPVNAVDRALELAPKDIQEVDGQRFCALDAISVPLKSLNQLLGQPTAKTRAACIPTIVTRAGGFPIGLVTDRILGQHEIFIKPLGPPLSSMLPLTGGAILGDGRIIFVIDATMLVGKNMGGNYCSPNPHCA